MTTRAEFFWEFYNEQNGKGIDTDGFGPQCVSLIKWFLKKLGDPNWRRPIGGDGFAHQIAYRFYELGYDEYFDWITGDAEIGDVLVYKVTNETPYSHVSFFLGDLPNGTQHYSWGQNQGAPGMVANTITLSNYGLIAVLRPKGFSDSEGAAAPKINDSGFSDVPESAWYYPAVKWGHDSGMVKGVGQSTEFRPNDVSTRADAILVMYRLKGEPKVAATNSFSDTKGHYAEAAIDWAVSKSITKGSGDTFEPDRAITRAEAISFIYRLAGEPEVAADTVNVFEDVNDKDWFYDAARWAVSNGYATAKTNFYPHNACTRAELITFLYRRCTDPNTAKKPEAAAPEISSFPITKFPAYGCDISYWNSDIDLTTIDHDFIIIRAGYSDAEDPLFMQNVRKCEALGIPWFAYWYSYAINKPMLDDEITTCLNTLSKTKGCLGVFFDMEDADGWKKRNDPAHWTTPNAATIKPLCTQFCEAISKAGYNVGIYTATSWLGYIDRSWPTWIANWGRNSGSVESDQSQEFALHQYTDTPLDRNIMYRPVFETEEDPQPTKCNCDCCEH